MIEIKNYDEVVQIRLCREIDGKPVFWVAAFFVDGLLIDTGCSYTVFELLFFLEKNSPQLAVNTHFHEDHIGANRAIQERFGINIYAHPESQALINQPAKLFPYQEIAWGYPQQSEVLSIPDTIRTDKYFFEILETPGHSAGHIVLIERSQCWCFCGDIFASERVKTIRPEEDMALTVSSLKKIVNLDMERLILFSSSGGVVENGREALLNYIGYLEGLANKSRELEKIGMSAADIVKIIFGGEHVRAVSTSGQYTTENLIRSVLKMNFSP